MSEFSLRETVQSPNGVYRITNLSLSAIFFYDSLSEDKVIVDFKTYQGEDFSASIKDNEYQDKIISSLISAQLSMIQSNNQARFSISISNSYVIGIIVSF